MLIISAYIRAEGCDSADSGQLEEGRGVGRKGTSPALPCVESGTGGGDAPISLSSPTDVILSSIEFKFYAFLIGCLMTVFHFSGATFLASDI